MRYLLWIIQFAKDPDHWAGWRGGVPGVEISSRLNTYLPSEASQVKLAWSIFLHILSRGFLRREALRKLPAQLCKEEGRFAAPASFAPGSRCVSALETGAEVALASKKEGFKEAVMS